MRFPMIATTLIDRKDLAAEPGDRFDSTPIQAAMLMYRKLARPATPADDVEPDVAPIPEPAPEIVEAPKRRRRSYRTRNLTAES
jgi:hypothetical protein